MDYIKKESIEKIGDSLFKVPSENVRGSFYTVGNIGGTCDCKADMMEKFCKHVAAVYKFFDFQSKFLQS